MSLSYSEPRNGPFRRMPDDARAALAQPRRARRRGSGTWCAPTPDSGLRRAASRRPAPARCRQPARSAARPAPPPARCRSARAPAAAVASIAWPAAVCAAGRGSRATPRPRGMPAGCRSPAPARRRARRSSLGAAVRALGLEQLAHERRDVSLHLDHAPGVWPTRARPARRGGAAGRSRPPVGSAACGPAAAPAPQAPRRPGRDATGPDATSTAPHDATAHRSPPAAHTRPPPTRSAAEGGYRVDPLPCDLHEQARPCRLVSDAGEAGTGERAQHASNRGR